MLKRPKRYDLESRNFIPITEEEWNMIIKKSKKRNVSLIFSKRIYAVCKIILERERMTTLLIRFHNLVMKEEIVLERWRDVLDIIIEKGKR